MIAGFFQAVGTSPCNALLHTRSSILLSSPVFHDSAGISTRPQEFWFKMLLMLASSSARLKSAFLMGTCLLMMVWVGSSDGSGSLPSSYFKWVSQFWSQSCGVLPTTLILHKDFLLLISLTVSHASLDLFQTVVSSISIIFCQSCFVFLGHMLYTDSLNGYSDAAHFLHLDFLGNFLSQFELLSSWDHFYLLPQSIFLAFSLPQNFFFCSINMGLC